MKSGEVAVFSSDTFVSVGLVRETLNYEQKFCQSVKLLHPKIQYTYIMRIYYLPRPIGSKKIAFLISGQSHILDRKNIFRG